jgi:hypothetical protein
MRAAVVAVVATLVIATPISATARAGESLTFKGAFELEGLAAIEIGKGCRGEGAFGRMERGARVRLSERDAAGDFQRLGTGRLRKGRIVESVDGEEVCRMPFALTARRTPASDSRIYLEVKDVAFDISWPASDVTDGDLGTWRCEYSDTACAEVVGGTG